MIKFSESLNEWHSPLFVDTLQNEINKLNEDELLLQQALQHGSHATKDNMKLIILSVGDNTETISAKVGVFYESLIPGCQCDDDPSSSNFENEYCELEFLISKLNAETRISIVS